MSMTLKMSDKPSFIQRFIKDRDRNAILICVVIAISFWLTDALSHTYSHDYNFTIEYELQDNVSFASVPRSAVEVRLSGQGWELLKASISRKFKHVPFSVLRPEVTRSDLIAAVYQHLSDYELVVREVDVDVMSLDINMVITRSLPIQLNMTAVCADGFVFKDSLHLTPANVSASGPSSLIERLGEIQIETVELKALSESLNQIVNVILPDEVYITIQPKQVHLMAEIEKDVRVTTLVPLQLEGDTAGLDFSPEMIRLSYSLGESLIGDPDLASMYAIATIAPKDTAIGKAEVQLMNVPEFVRNMQFQPDSLTITVRSSED